MSIRIITLGAVQVVRGDTVLSALPSQRLRCALLVYLAVSRRATRDRLLSVFWPERTEERARHALSQNIYELRRALGDDWIEIQGEQFTIASDVSIDLPAFEESVERGDHGMALGLYRGPFLDGFYLSSAQAFDGWVDGVRQRVQRLHRRARREWIKQLVDQARLKEALASARDWTALDPGDDEAQHRLIELLAETGDRAGAIRQFEVYERLLAAEELEPLDDTRALIDRVRNGEVGALPGGSAIRASAPSRAAPAPSDSAPPAPAEATPADVVTSAKISLLRRRGRRLAVGIVCALLVMTGSLIFAVSRQPEDLTAATAPRRIAILYFDDRSPPPGVPHLAAGLTETLIDAFSGLDPLLTVRSKHAVGPMRNSPLSWDSVATSLDVDLVISGRVVRADGYVRVNVELVDAATGSLLGNGQVQRAEGEYLELLDDLVERVALLLRQRIGAQLEMERRRTRAPNWDAWSMLRLGMEAHATAVQILLDGEVDRARAEFARADSLLIRAEQSSGKWIEPTIQRGWLAERRGHIELAMRNEERGRAWLEAAVGHANRALERVPGSSEAFELRGSALSRTAAFASHDVAEIAELRVRAEEDLRRATKADSGRAHAFSILGSLYYSQARFSEANQAARQAHQLDAFLTQRLDNLYYIAMTEFELGRDEEAAKRCREGSRQFKDWRFAYCALTVMAWSDHMKADPDSAWAVVNRIRSAHDTTPGPTMRPMLEMLVAGTLLRAGLADSARAVLDRATLKPSLSPASPWIEAAVRGRLGDTQRAAYLLRQDFPQGGVLGPAVLKGRALRPLLNDPAIRNALERPVSR